MDFGEAASKRQRIQDNSKDVPGTAAGGHLSSEMETRVVSADWESSIAGQIVDSGQPQLALEVDIDMAQALPLHQHMERPLETGSPHYASGKHSLEYAMASAFPSTTHDGRGAAKRRVQHIEIRVR